MLMKVNGFGSDSFEGVEGSEKEMREKFCVTIFSFHIHHSLVSRKKKRRRKDAQTLMAYTGFLSPLPVLKIQWIFAHG